MSLETPWKKVYFNGLKSCDSCYHHKFRSLSHADIPLNLYNRGRLIDACLAAETAISTEEPPMNDTDNRVVRNLEPSNCRPLNGVRDLAGECGLLTSPRFVAVTKALSPANLLDPFLPINVILTKSTLKFAIVAARFVQRVSFDSSI